MSSCPLISAHCARALKPLSATNNSGGLRTAARLTWVLLVWPTWLAAAVLESTLLFVTERGFYFVAIIVGGGNGPSC